MQRLHEYGPAPPQRECTTREPEGGATNQRLTQNASLILAWAEPFTIKSEQTQEARRKAHEQPATNRQQQTATHHTGGRGCAQSTTSQLPGAATQCRHVPGSYGLHLAFQGCHPISKLLERMLELREILGHRRGLPGHPTVNVRKHVKGTSLEGIIIIIPGIPHCC